MLPQKKQQQKKKKKIYGFIWPRDPQPAAHERTWLKNRLADWRDILTGKGPDIFIGRLDRLEQTAPKQGKWSRWDYIRGVEEEEEEEEEDRESEAETGPSPDHLTLPTLLLHHPHQWLFPKRPAWEVYDFKTRRYARWRGDMWSHVAYCSNAAHPTPRCYVDGYGYHHDLRAWPR